MIGTENSIEKIFSILSAGGYSIRFRGSSAINMYLKLPALT